MRALNRIEFADIMNFYPKHNDAVYKMIVAAQQAGSLIPFIGAGMSAFCGYKLWGAVLNDLAEFIFNEDERQTAINQIHNGDYEEAAQTILDAYPVMLDQLPEIISPNKLEACSQEKLQASAVFVLPYLFPKGLVMTTNFDRVLENVYLKHAGRPLEVVTPNQQDLLAQLRQNQSLGLFKLHGDIGDDTVSMDDLVFTGKQYEEKYADDSPLVQELIRWFENRKLLFLGCSLNVDRTMKVLQDVTKSQTGIRHFAILSCKKNDIPNRLKELKSHGILPIFYDESNHDAVRIILERLLEDTDQASYKDLRMASRVVPDATQEERRLLFDADYFPFTGRKKELESLDAFCASDDNISWWAVTGPGGMGKSRLVYEFTNKKRENGWQIVRFEAHPSKGSNAASMESLNEWFPSSPQTLVVLDDVQAYMERIWHWLSVVVRRPRSEKLRILLLEREGRNLNSSSWLGTESCDDILVDWCHEEDFLYLEPMDDEHLVSIMNNFATAAGKTLNAELLLKTLERVDPELKRPLYAIAIADAYCQGKNPTNWDRKMVLDTLLDRELDFHLSRFRGLTGTRVTKTLKAEIKELIARSCVLGILPLDVLKLERYPKLVKKMNDVDMDAQEFLEGLGLLRTVSLSLISLDEFGNPIGEPSKKEKRKVVALSCPDLIKEHLVLNMALQDGKSDILFPQNWEHNPRRVAFFGHLLADYSDRLKEQSDYWKSFFRAMPQNLLTARIYGRILWLYVAIYPDRAKVAVDRLAQLYKEVKYAPEIAVEYAKGLVNSTINHDLVICMEAVEKLGELRQSHPNIPEIAAQYACGLANLSVDQDSEGRAETAKRLGELYQTHIDIPEITVQYAYGLFNLCANQDSEEYEKTIARLNELYQKHSDIPDVAIQLAKGLAIGNSNQDLNGCINAVTQLDKLFQNYPDSLDVAISYAVRLVVLSLHQDIKERAETITQLNALYHIHPNNLEMAVLLANGLVILAIKQDLSERIETIERLNDLYQNHHNSPKIAGWFANGLVILSLNQDIKGCTETVAKLKELYHNHLDSPEIAVEYAKGLVSLSNVQELTARTETVKKLNLLYQRSSDSQEITGQYAKGLFNLTCNQDFARTQEAVEQLNELYQKHPDWEFVAEAFASSLVNLSLCQANEDAVRITLDRASTILYQYPDNRNIQLDFAQTWFNLTLQQNDTDIPDTVADIISFLRSNADIIPWFKDALDKYLSDHPEHVTRYQLFQEL